jgi:hypothetical protein
MATKPSVRGQRGWAVDPASAHQRQGPAAPSTPGARTKERNLHATTDHPIPVSPGLHRPGLDPEPAPEPALHLLGGIWVASCATCGFLLCTARTQERVERRARYRSCPICRGADAA